MPPSPCSGWRPASAGSRLPPQYKAFDHDWVIYTAIVLYAGRVPRRQDPLGRHRSGTRCTRSSGRSAGRSSRSRRSARPSPAVTGADRRSSAASWRAAPTSRRPARASWPTPSPEPFTNWLLSLGEDVFVVGLGLRGAQVPGGWRWSSWWCCWA
ncbi:MAG: DUF4126 domain-containing protein [Ignavibacteriales bacterium]|nr:DUF4126 domain-containing protein [Ignavibacteriales bacterium]